MFFYFIAHFWDQVCDQFVILQGYWSEVPAGVYRLSVTDSLSLVHYPWMQGGERMVWGRGCITVSMALIFIIHVCVLVIMNLDGYGTIICSEGICY